MPDKCSLFGVFPGHPKKRVSGWHKGECNDPASAARLAGSVCKRWFALILVYIYFFHFDLLQPIAPCLDELILGFTFNLSP